MIITKFDDIFNKIGHLGKYQIYLYTILSLCCFNAGINNNMSIFSQRNMPATCNLRNGTQHITTDSERCPNIINNDSCNVYNLLNNETETCKSWTFDEQYGSSIVSSFKLLW